MYNAEVREKVGGLHLMNPTNLFHVILPCVFTSQHYLRLDNFCVSFFVLYNNYAYFCILILMNCNAISFDLQYKDKMILCKKQTEILYFVAIINLLNRL